MKTHDQLVISLSVLYRSELKTFPAGVLIKYQDIKIQKEIGEGNFGKVYQGHLNLNEVQRYTNI